MKGTFSFPFSLSHSPFLGRRGGASGLARTAGRLFSKPTWLVCSLSSSSEPSSLLHGLPCHLELILTLLFFPSPPSPPRCCTGYIGAFEIIDDHRSGKIVIELNGRLNKTGVISPRFNVQVDEIESWVNLLLPSRSFGLIILTTSAGIMDHEEARRKHVGGKLLGYVY